MDHNQICLLQFPTHTVRITCNEDGRIQCFKYDQSACDMAVFEESDQESAADYILTALPSMVYYVNVTDD